jgi:hypothetical protein
LVGQRTGRRWQLGSAVNVRLVRVDVTQRQIDFELLDGSGATSEGPVRAPRRGGDSNRRGGGRERGGRSGGRGRGGRSGRGGRG